MPEQEPVTQVIDVAEARARWSQLLSQVARSETRVVVEMSGIPVAAIISAADLDRFNHYEAERVKRTSVIDEARAAFKDVPADEIESEVARALAEVRKEARTRAGN